MRNCEITNEVFYKGKHYYEVVTKNSNKHFYFRDFSGDDIKVITKEEFDKVLNDKNGLSIKNKIASKLILPVIISGMVTSSLSGCSKNSDKNIEPTKVEINQDSIDDINEPTIIDDNYYRVLTVDELKKCGVTFDLVDDKSIVYGDVLIYKVNNIDLERIPKNIIFEGLEKNYKRVDNINFDTNVTWDDCIKEIKNKKIDEKYEKLLINVVEKYKSLGLEKGLPLLYNNIKNSEFVMDPLHPSAMFQHFAHKLIIGSADIKNNEFELEGLRMLVNEGRLTEEEYNLSLTQDEYVITHEPGHMISVYYDDATNELLTSDGIYAVVEKGSNKIFDFIDLGQFLNEGFADYLTYEVINRKPTKMYGYSINQSIYLAIKEMFGLNSIEELRTFNIDKFMNKLKEIGFSTIFDWALFFDQIVISDLDILYGRANEINEIDYTEVLETFFQEYYDAQIKNGLSNEEIKEVFDRIIKNIRDRVAITNKNGDLVVEGTYSYTFMCTSCLEEYANYITSQKTKSLK